MNLLKSYEQQKIHLLHNVPPLTMKNKASFLLHQSFWNCFFFLGAHHQLHLVKRPLLPTDLKATKPASDRNAASGLGLRNPVEGIMAKLKCCFYSSFSHSFGKCKHNVSTHNDAADSRRRGFSTSCDTMSVWKVRQSLRLYFTPAAEACATRSQSAVALRRSRCASLTAASTTPRLSAWEAR